MVGLFSRSLSCWGFSQGCSVACVCLTSYRATCPALSPGEAWVVLPVPGLGTPCCARSALLRACQDRCYCSPSNTCRAIPRPVHQASLLLSRPTQASLPAVFPGRCSSVSLGLFLSLTSVPGATGTPSRLPLPLPPVLPGLWALSENTTFSLYPSCGTCYFPCSVSFLEKDTWSRFSVSGCF